MARLSATSSFATGNGHLHSQEAERQEETKSPPNNAPSIQPMPDWPPRHHQRHHSLPSDTSLLPTGSRSLSSISLQSFVLGIALATSTTLSLYLAFQRQQPLWRLPAFFAALSLFHFLEFWTTATYNLPAARASSFLLFNNGAAYNVAHSLAALEILLSCTVLPAWYGTLLVSPFTIALGALLVVMGQVVRSVAMAQAGTNFNHTPARTKREGHVLVMTGVYAWLRHPSYFGFFWWALGTQVVVGNKVCVLGYLAALWTFFARRIEGEEVNLVEFFGEEYENYRARTWTGIPLIR